MQQHVGVAVADELPVVRHVDAAQPQRPARRGAVRVFADADPQVARGAVSVRGGKLVNCADYTRRPKTRQREQGAVS